MPSMAAWLFSNTSSVDLEEARRNQNHDRNDEKLRYHVVRLIVDAKHDLRIRLKAARQLCPKLAELFGRGCSGI